MHCDGANQNHDLHIYHSVSLLQYILMYLICTKLKPIAEGDNFGFSKTNSSLWINYVILLAYL